MPPPLLWYNELYLNKNIALLTYIMRLFRSPIYDVSVLWATHLLPDFTPYPRR